jgi:hypothetical protein
MIKKQANEEYRVIEGFDGKYLVSNLGNVYSTKRNIQMATTTYTDKRKGTTFNTSYKRVGLSHKGKKKLYPVHRLVATAFIPNPENKRTVNHKDGNKLNNTIDNLEWATDAENIQHAYDTGLNSQRFKLKVDEEMANHLFNSRVMKGETITSIAKTLGIGVTQLSYRIKEASIRLNKEIEYAEELKRQKLVRQSKAK